MTTLTGPDERTTHPPGEPRDAPRTPWTMLPKCPAFSGALDKRGWADFVDHPDLILIDFDAFDHRTNDLSLCLPVGLLETVLDALGEFFKLADDQAKLVRIGFAVCGGFRIRLQVRQSLPGLLHAWFKLVLFQQTIFVGIDESSNATFHLADHGVQLLCLWRPVCGLPLQSSFVLVPDALRIVQQIADVLPDGGLQQVCANRFIGADAFASKAMCIAAVAAVVGVWPLSAFRRGTTDGFAVVSVTATLALEQSLKQVPHSVLLCAGSLFVLFRLRPHRFKQIGTDDCGNGDQFVFVLWHGIDRKITPRLGTASMRTKSRQTRPPTRLAKRRSPLIGGVPQHSTDSAARPVDSACGRTDSLLLQPSTDRPDRQSFEGHPLEDFAHDASFFKHDPEVSFSAPLVLAHIPVAIWSAGQHIHRTTTGCVTFPAPRAFHDLGPLIFGNHPLHLQQQIFFRATAQRVIQEHEFHTMMFHFIDQQYLVGVLARQSIGRMHVDAIDAPRIGHISQLLQSWPYKRASAVSIIDESQFRLQIQTIVANTLLKCLDLAGDRLLLGLLFGRHSSIDCRSNLLTFHDHPPA